MHKACWYADIGPPMKANASLGVPRVEACPEARSIKVDSEMLTLSRCGEGRGVSIYLGITQVQVFITASSTR
jgi:hypothetical protein